MTLCFCGGEIATHGNRAMCMACGHLTKLPAGECSSDDPAQLPGGRGRSSSQFAPAGAFYTLPRGWQVSADAAPGGLLHPQADWARQLTQEPMMTKRDRFPPLASQRDLDREPALPTLGDWFGGIALFAGTVALYFIGGGIAG